MELKSKLRSSIPIWAVIALVIVVSAGTATAVTIVTIDANPIAPGSGTLSGSSDLTLNSQELQYSGNNVTAVDVNVSNSAASDHTGDVYVVLQDSSGNTVASETVTDQTFTANSDTITTASFTTEHAPDTFSRVEVNVEETG